MWGTTSLGRNVAKVKERLGDKAPVDSWALIFDPANAERLADCGISMLDDPTEVFSAALAYLGKDPNSTAKADLDAATALLQKVRPYIRYFHSSQYINDLANGDLCVVHGYSGDILQARDRATEANNGVEVALAIPREGAVLAVDVMAIPADAQNVDEALAFLDYIMRPDVIAKASNYVAYANGNKASQEVMDKEVLEDPAVYPTAEATSRLYTKLAYDPKTQRVATRLWTKVTTGQ